MEDLEKHKDDPEKEVIEAQLALLNARDQLSRVVLEKLQKIS